MSDTPHRVRKKLAHGVAWYVYAWRGGPQIFRSEGPKKPVLTTAILKAAVQAQEKRVSSSPDNLRSLIRLWRSQNPARPFSPEWERLASTTKKTWGSALDKIEEKWGEVPLVLFNDPRMKAKVVEWRDSRASQPRAADIGITVLSALLKFGTLRGKVLTNVAAGIPTLYRGGDRAEIVWTDDEIERFARKASELALVSVADALRLAATTGLRREDLVTLTWDHITQFAIVKKAKKRSRGRRRFATVVRVPELDAVLADLRLRPRQVGVTTVLVDHAGAPWTPDRLTKAVGRVRDEIGIVHVDAETGVRRKKHLHDARGTYATKLMISTDLTDAEIAGMMGWTPEETSRIRHVYVDQTKAIVALAERLNRRSV